MEIILSIIVLIITIIPCTVIFSMIILSAFFGIPQTIKLKRERILVREATIKPYLITIILWLSIVSLSLIILYNILEKIYFIEVIYGTIIAIFISFKSLSKNNYENNMEELLKIQANFINPNFINFVNNGIQNVLLEKANNLAISRGFNNWQELEEKFIEENNIKADLTNMIFEEKLNYIAKTVGFNDFNDLYNQCINENIQK